MTRSKGGYGEQFDVYLRLGIEPSVDQTTGWVTIGDETWLPEEWASVGSHMWAAAERRVKAEMKSKSEGTSK